MKVVAHHRKTADTHREDLSKLFANHPAKFR
jgi:hypothetical protein